MDARLRALCKQLRAMISDEAVTWLMENYHPGSDQCGEAFLLIPHRSWSKPEQLRLARYYLQHIPFASAKPLEAFATFMPVRTLVKVIREHLPNVKADRIGLLLYFLAPLLRAKAITAADVKAWDELVKELKRAEKQNAN